MKVYYITIYIYVYARHLNQNCILYNNLAEPREQKFLKFSCRFFIVQTGINYKYVQLIILFTDVRNADHFVSNDDSRRYYLHNC